MVVRDYVVGVLEIHNSHDSIMERVLGAKLSSVIVTHIQIVW